MAKKPEESRTVRVARALELDAWRLAAQAHELLLKITPKPETVARPTPEFWKRTAREKAGLLLCSFCEGGQREVKVLIAGPTVYICDDCVGLCAQIVAEHGAKRCLKCNTVITDPAWGCPDFACNPKLAVPESPESKT